VGGQANCPAGKIAVGGGGRIVGLINTLAADGTGPHLTASNPIGGATGWEATAISSAAYNNQFGLSTFAICVNQPS
jgi:hypothetical protein